MCWFVYKDQPVRRYRKGIWLRVRSLPKAILEEARKKLTRKHHILWVVVKELQPDGYAILEFWCQKNPYKDEIYTVLYLRVKEDPEWVCEGDLGRGLVGEN